jgi:hypothetical protein
MTDTNSKAQVTGAVTQEYTLRAMANNYGDGPHSWDSLDKECCLKAADEIRGLRSALASYPSPIPRLPNCGRYIAQDNKGQWHYLNHAGTWQCYQGPALAAQEKPEPGVEVKALEWSVERRHGFNIHVGKGLGLKYEAAGKAYSPGWIVTLGQDIVVFDADTDEETAKSAAQSDYERRIRSALVSTQAQAGEPAWWIVKTDMGKVIFHGPDKSRADLVAAIHNRTAEPLYATPPQSCADEMFRQMVLIKSLADNTSERNWADKRLYIMQAAIRSLGKEGSGE